MIGQRNTANLSRPALVQTGEKLWLALRLESRGWIKGRWIEKSGEQ